MPDETATVVRRLLAFLLDLALLPVAWLVLMFAVAFVLGMAAGISGQSDSSDRWTDALFTPVPVVISFLVAQVVYEWFFESVGRRATIGKRVLRLRVAGVDGRSAPRKRVLVRAVVKLFLPGALAAFASSRRQALHDVAAGTVVILREPKASQPTTSIAPPA